MKQKKHITDGDNNFIIEVNSNIDHLNRLIDEYNQAPKEDALEILLEIYSYQEHIANKYPANQINKSSGYRAIFQGELFVELKAEFATFGLGSMAAADVSKFDCLKIIPKPEAESGLLSQMFKNIHSPTSGPQPIDLLLQKDDTAFNDFFQPNDPQNLLDYEFKIKTVITKMAAENNPVKMYKDLKQLKELIRVALADNDLSNDQTASLRTLVAAINTKINFLEKKYPAITSKQNFAANHFAQFVANMEPDKVNGFTRFLSLAANKYAVERQDEVKRAKLAGVTPNPTIINHLLVDDPQTTKNLGELYPSSAPEYAQYQQLLKNHTIEFIWQGNSTLFKLKHRMTGMQTVLKIDYRLDNPKSMEAKLAANALSETITQIYADRTATFESATGIRITRGLLLAEYCGSGDIMAHSSKYDDAQNPDYANHEGRAQSAVFIYKQMAQIFEEIRKEGVAFPDAKNTNWLVDNQGNVRISDTKSFIPSYNGCVIQNDLSDDWYDQISSGYMSPPEFYDYATPYDVDKAHAFMLGKNLYQYLTGCDANRLSASGYDASNYNFSHDVFKTQMGGELGNLIKDLIKQDAQNRCSIAEAQQRLNVIELRKQLFEQLENSGVFENPTFNDLPQEARISYDIQRLEYYKSTGLNNYLITTITNDCNKMIKDINASGLQDKIIMGKLSSEFNKALGDMTQLKNIKTALNGQLAAVELVKLKQECTELLDRLVIVHPLAWKDDSEQFKLENIQDKKVTKDSLLVLKQQLDNQILSIETSLSSAKTYWQQSNKECKELDLKIAGIVKANPTIDYTSPYMNHKDKDRNFDALIIDDVKGTVELDRAIAEMVNLKIEMQEKLQQIQLKVECNALIDKIEEFTVTAKDANKDLLNKEAIGKEANFDVLKGVHAQLKTLLIDAENQHKNAKKECTNLLHEVVRMYATDGRSELFRLETAKHIGASNDPKSLSDVKKDLEAIKDVLTIVHAAIDKYRAEAKKEIFGNAGKLKVSEIERALAKVPIELIGKVFEKEGMYAADPRMQELRKAIEPGEGKKNTKNIFLDIKDKMDTLLNKEKPEDLKTEGKDRGPA